jgi:hypothetical protein
VDFNIDSILLMQYWPYMYTYIYHLESFQGRKVILGNIFLNYAQIIQLLLKFLDAHVFKHRSFQSLIFTCQGNTEQGKTKMAIQNKVVRIKNAFSLLSKRRDSDKVM